MTVSSARQALLAGLSASLEALASRLRRQGEAAAEIALLAVRAEQIAADARRLGTSRPSPATVEHLGEQLDALARDVARLAGCAASEATLGREVAAALLAHAPGLADLPSVTDIAELRRRLQPLASTLEQMPASLRRGGGALAADLSVLARRAGDLADEAHEAAADPAVLRLAAQQLGRGLRGFAEDVAAIATRLSQDAVVAERAAHALVAQASGGDARLGAVVEGAHAALAGRALVWPPIGAA